VSGWTGLTWDHPRGYQALRAATLHQDAPSCDLHWDTQPLAGLESAPIGIAAQAYDLIVLEHAHLGEALARGVLRPIDELFGADEVAAWRAGTVGPLADSYVMAEQLWALPLDAAAQVSVRNDAGIALPDTWGDAVELAAEVTALLPTTGPHPFLTLCAIAVANGARPGSGSEFLAEDQVYEAVDTLRHFVSGHRGEQDPISVLDQMSTSSEPIYCPHIDGYAHYAQGAQPLLFGDAPRGSAGRRGSALGGTGIAFSAQREPDPALLDHVRWLMTPDVQRGFLAEAGGQPGSVAAWDDSTVDATANGFYRATRATIDDAWIRPRHNGAVGFQGAAADAVRNCLFDHRNASRLARVINVLYDASLDDEEGAV
jgi:multiple sugar transport system substrate-binding protein